MFLDAINMKFMERYFFFMKIYRGKAIFIMLVAGLMFARSEVTFWQRVLSIYFLLFVIILIIFSFMMKEDSCY
jgi:hypothetical protein